MIEKTTDELKKIVEEGIKAGVTENKGLISNLAFVATGLTFFAIGVKKLLK